MPRQEYQESLSNLRDDVLYMSEVVAERLRLGLDALEQKNEATAKEVVDGDDEVNQMYLDLEGQCVDLIALQQPVASDLRFIAASFKIITDLERIGDLAVNLAQYAMDADRDVFPEVDVQQIGVETLEMLESAMAAYANEDPEACYEVADRDDDLDAMCEAASSIVVRDLIEQDPFGDGSEDAEAYLQDISRLLLTVRDLERVGDHAVNIAARTLAGQEGLHPAVGIESLGGDAAAMVEAAIEAYETADPEACRALAARDDDLDGACDRATRRIIRSLLAETDVDRAAARTAASRGLLTVRDIERVGDHAVNIAARTLYMVENDDELLY